MTIPCLKNCLETIVAKTGVTKNALPVDRLFLCCLCSRFKLKCQALPSL